MIITNYTQNIRAKNVWSFISSRFWRTEAPGYGAISNFQGEIKNVIFWFLAFYCAIKWKIHTATAIHFYANFVKLDSFSSPSAAVWKKYMHMYKYNWVLKPLGYSVSYLGTPSLNLSWQVLRTNQSHESSQEVRESAHIWMQTAHAYIVWGYHRTWSDQPYFWEKWTKTASVQTHLEWDACKGSSEETVIPINQVMDSSQKRWQILVLWQPTRAYLIKHIINHPVRSSLLWSKNYLDWNFLTLSVH